MVQKLLKHANINSKVLFVGQGKTFQMWDPNNFKRFSLSAQKKANLKRAELNGKAKTKKPTKRRREIMPINISAPELRK